jgi:gliding motility-associated-like protein
MSKKSFFIIFLIVTLWETSSFSQTGCTVPSPPVFTSVDIDPESGVTRLTWQLSTSDSIAAYIVYAYRDNAGFPVDTIRDPAAVSYEYTTTSWRYFSVAYTITAFRLPDCESPLSNVLNTIFLETELDTCAGTIKLRWNKYHDYPKRVTGYSILISRDGGPLTQTYNLSANAVDTTITSFIPGSEYCFVVRANLADGTSSGSNKACVTTSIQRPPEWINADFASVAGNKSVALSFTVDPHSEIEKFMLERKTGEGAFQLLALLSPAGGKVIYNDESADIGKVNYYRLSAINTCNKPVTLSNVASNIVLSPELRTSHLVLSWNMPLFLPGSSATTSIHMDSGNGFNQVATVSADSLFTILLKDIMYEITTGELCFYVTITETGNTHGINGESVSAITCITPVETVTVPNVFTPNNDLRNDRFSPVLSFTPRDYLLVITDRQGKVFFETNDFMDEWDGSGSQGGVFLWHLKLTTPSGQNISRTGTVTVFIP